MSDRGPFGDLRDRLSSFRTRLRLFFVLIVIVPMIAVTLIVFRLIAESEQGQADARVAARQEAAITLYYDARARADRSRRDRPRPRARHGAARRRRPGRPRGGPRLRATTQRASASCSRAAGACWPTSATRRASFPATPHARLRRPARRRPAGLGPRRRRPTRGSCGASRIWRRSCGAATRCSPRRSRRPRRRSCRAGRGKVAVGGQEFRAATFAAPGFGGEPLERLGARAAGAHDLATSAAAGCSPASSSPGFFLLALVSAIVVSRSLTARSRSSWRPRAAWAAATSPRGADPRPRPVRPARRASSTRCPSSSSTASRSSPRSACASSCRCAASARRSPPTWTATGCWRSWCARPSTPSTPTAATR